MGAQQFQNLVLVWIAVIATLVPALIGMLILIVNQLQRLLDVLATLRWHEKAINDSAVKVASIEKALNGTLSHASNTAPNVNPPVGVPGDSGP